MKETTKINKEDDKLLKKVTELDMNKNNAYNIRKNGKSIVRNITDDVRIESKKDGTGIDIYVKENTKNALVMIPVILTDTGLNDKVYNDFYIGKNANCTIMAGCAIKNGGHKDSSHQGIHRFFLEENSKAKYLETHYGVGSGNGHKILDPITEFELKEGSVLDINTVQIEGVDSTIRYTKGVVFDNATLRISEKIMTHGKQKAKTEFDIDLNGNNASTHIVSRSVACGDSEQLFISRLNGNSKCYGHVECDGILKDNGIVIAKPEVSANYIDANLVHEATIGKIAGEQLLKLMSLGLSEEEAEAEIINGFLK